MRKLVRYFLCLALFLCILPVINVHAEDENTDETAVQDNNDNVNNDHNEEIHTFNSVTDENADNVPYYRNDFVTYSELPSAYQMDKNIFPGVRDQGSYGTCWAFAALGLSEFDLVKKGIADKNIDLSELQLAYYTYNSVVDPLGGTAGDISRYYNENTNTNYLNVGGTYQYAVRRLSQWSGAVKETDVPYNAATINNVLANGLSDEYAYSKDVAHLQNAYVLSIKNNTDDVKRAIIEHGAVGVQYYHSYNCLLWNDSNQLLTYYDPAITGGAHNVMIVGWDDNFSKENFVGDNKPEHDGAWLIRNSWGFTQSYFWMYYDNHSLSDSAWVFDMQTADKYDNNYQLDGGLDSYNVTSNICSYKTYANVFTVQNNAEVASESLDAVSLSFTRVANVNYKIEIYTDLKDSNPYSGTKQEAATTQGTTTYAGYYTIPLNHSIELKPGSSFAVVVTTDSYALDYEQGIHWVVDPSVSNSATIWDASVSLANGKSFYGNSNYQWGWNWGNFCIKAFTTNNYKYKDKMDISNAVITKDSDFSLDNPRIKVIYNEKVLEENVDYTMSYTINSFKSKFRVTINGINDYQGTLYQVLQIYSDIGESLNEYSLCLNGLIEMYFHFYLTDELKNDDGAYVLFTLSNGRQKKQYIKDTEYIDGFGYRFKFGLYASEMTEPVKFVFINSNGERSKEYSRSIADYTKSIFNNTNNEVYKKVTPLLKSMLNYGGYAQEMFHVNEDDLAYTDVKDELSDKMNEISADDLQQYKLIKSGSDANIIFKEYALELKEATSIRVYFTVNDQSDLSTCKAFVDGKETTIKNDSRGYYVEVPSIASNKLDIAHTVNIGGLEFKVSALSWVRSILNKGNSVEKNTSDVAKAIFLYWNESKKYFG